MLVFLYVAAIWSRYMPTKTFDKFLNTAKRETSLWKYDSAAVVVDSRYCSEIGSDILARNGSAADAAIAAMLCNGVANMHSMGLGGATVLVFYQKSTNTSWFIDGQSTSPAKLLKWDKNEKWKEASGPAYITIPGHLAAMWELWIRFGRLPWQDLFQPSIKMCREGFYASRALSRAFVQVLDIIGMDPPSSARLKRLVSEVDLKTVAGMGSVCYCERLAKTYERIAEEGMDSFYKGGLADDILADLKEVNSQITKEDWSSYRARVTPALQIPLRNNRILHSAGAPASGGPVQLAMHCIDHFNNSKRFAKKMNEETVHLIAESIKMAFGHRISIADTVYNEVARQTMLTLTNATARQNICEKIKRNGVLHRNEYMSHYSEEDLNEEGTAHLNVLSPNGDAISATSTVNGYFGSCIMGKRTGIVFSNAMDDFSLKDVDNRFGLPPATANFPEPGKRSATSMSPTIVTRNDKVEVVIGGAGGSRIPSIIIWVLTRLLYLDNDLKTAVDAKRIHHQLFPDELSMERRGHKVRGKLANSLRKLGHNVVGWGNGKTVVQGIHVNSLNGEITAYSDFRKGGTPAGF